AADDAVGHVQAVLGRGIEPVVVDLHPGEADPAGGEAAHAGAGQPDVVEELDEVAAGDVVDVVVGDVPVGGARVGVDAVVLLRTGAGEAVDVVAQHLDLVAVAGHAGGLAVDGRRPRAELVVDHAPRAGRVLQVDRRGIGGGVGVHVHAQVGDRNPVAGGAEVGRVGAVD